MRPLWLAAAGLVMVVVDFRVYSVDVVPDVTGWVLLAVVLHRLVGRRWALVAVVGGIGSLAEVALPCHYELVEGRVLDPGSGEPMAGAVEVQEFDPRRRHHHRRLRCRAALRGPGAVGAAAGTATASRELVSERGRVLSVLDRTVTAVEVPERTPRLNRPRGCRSVGHARCVPHRR